MKEYFRKFHKLRKCWLSEGKRRLGSLSAFLTGKKINANSEVIGQLMVSSQSIGTPFSSNTLK